MEEVNSSEFDPVIEVEGYAAVQPDPLYPEVDIESVFTDVKNGNYAAKAIDFVTGNNIITGGKDDQGAKFFPAHVMTREELAVAFFQFKRYIDKVFKVETIFNSVTTLKNSFTVKTPGHVYQVPQVEKRYMQQEIYFLHKEKNPETGALDLVNDGITNEQLIEVLVDRINYLNGKHPCRENALAVTKLQEALFWLNKRTADRINRGVEGTDQK